MEIFNLGLYKPAFDRTFINHPNGKNIVNALIKHQLSFNEIDLVFQEAEYYNMMTLLKKRNSHGS